MLGQNTFDKNFAIRMKEIQSSALHVKNIIQSTKKIIHNQQLSSEEKQILEIKISIEKDHLKNSLHKIHGPDSHFTLQISEKISKNLPQFINTNLSSMQRFNERKFNSKPDTEHSLQRSNKNFSSRQPTVDVSQYRINLGFSDSPETKIKISRLIKDQCSGIKQQSRASSVQLYQIQNNQQYSIKLEDGSLIRIQPTKNSKVLVSTRMESIWPNSSNPLHKNQFSSKQKYQQKHTSALTANSNQKDLSIRKSHEDLSFASNQAQNMLILQFSPFQKIYKQVKLRPKIQPKLYNDTPLLSSQQRHKNQKQMQSSYQQILEKNKQKLEKSISKINDKQSISQTHKLHLEQLTKKKQQNKKRLYGSSSNHPKSSSTSFLKKFSIANNKKLGTDTDFQKSKKNRSLSKSCLPSFNSIQLQKSKTLHTSTLKLNHTFCPTCVRCKSRNFPSTVQSQQALQSFHLAKKYLTPEGQRQCYNFLRAQGIPESKWPGFVTEYVYRQLSKTYQKVKSQQK